MKPEKVKTLECEFCLATAPNNSKYAGRFKRRHHGKVKVCLIKAGVQKADAVFHQQLAEGVRSIEE